MRIYNYKILHVNYHHENSNNLSIRILIYLWSVNSLNPAIEASIIKRMKRERLIFKEHWSNYHRNERAKCTAGIICMEVGSMGKTAICSMPSANPFCSYLPRTRMRMLNSSAVPNGQLAILTWTVTSIQLSPETIQALPNQSTHPSTNPSYSTTNYNSPILSLSHSLPFIHPLTIHNCCLSLILTIETRSTFQLLPNPGTSWQTARSSIQNLPYKSLLSPFTLSTPSHLHANLPCPISTVFFLSSLSFSLSFFGTCTRKFVRSIKVLPDGTRRQTYIIVKHAVRAT